MPCLKTGILTLDCISYECVFPAFAHPCSKTRNDLSRKHAKFYKLLADLRLNLTKSTFPVIWLQLPLNKDCYYDTRWL